MQSILNFIRGSVRIHLECSYPERFFNLCARGNIKFWDMETVSPGEVLITLPIKDFEKLRPIARKVFCRIHIVGKSGLPFFLHKFRKRNGFIAGCIAFCLIIWVLVNFIWVIEIDGFEELDRGKLLSELSDCGIRIGAYIPRIDRTTLRNNVLINMPELSYVYVNFNGCHATVIAKKRTAPPEILNENVPCDIIADKDGMICDITVKTGSPEVIRGDTVTKGQLLVSGYMTGRAGATVITHADADIKAKIWKKVSARMMKKQSEKKYTGEEKTVRAIILFGKRIKLYFNSGISYMKCDKIIRKTDLTLFRGMKLPISLEESVYREYETEASVISDEEAYSVLGERLNLVLTPSEDGEISDISFKTGSDEEFAYAEMNAECIEKIGSKKEILKIG